jgi:hypothetical protein
VFIEAEVAPARFEAPSDEDVAAILARVVRRATKVLERFADDLDPAADALGGLQAVEVDGGSGVPNPSSKRVAARSWKGTPCTPSSGCTATTGREGSNSAGTSSGHRWRFTGCHARRTAASSTG